MKKLASIPFPKVTVFNMIEFMVVLRNLNQNTAN